MRESGNAITFSVMRSSNRPIVALRSSFGIVRTCTSHALRSARHANNDLSRLKARKFGWKSWKGSEREALAEPCAKGFGHDGTRRGPGTGRILCFGTLRFARSPSWPNCAKITAAIKEEYDRLNLEELQEPTADSGTSWQETTQAHEAHGLMPQSSRGCYNNPKALAPRVGTEQEPNSSGKQEFAGKRNAFSDALFDVSILNDHDLVELLQAWPNLAPEARAKILTIAHQEVEE